MKKNATPGMYTSVVISQNLLSHQQNTKQKWQKVLRKWRDRRKLVGVFSILFLLITNTVFVNCQPICEPNCTENLLNNPTIALTSIPTNYGQLYGSVQTNRAIPWIRSFGTHHHQNVIQENGNLWTCNLFPPYTGNSAQTDPT